MADLISSSDWGEIRSALEDVKDTFFKFPVIFRKRTTRKLTNFHESREADLDYIDYPLLALKVEEKTDNESRGTENKEGSVDIAEGYIYLSYQKLLVTNPPLITASTFDDTFDETFTDGGGRHQFVLNKDSFIFDGMEHTILGVNLVGPTQSDFQLVKITYKKQLQK
jgi:hypothetical protein